MSTTVFVVDVHDNDGAGQEDCEAVYVDRLRVDAGATLDNPGCRVYYRELDLEGEVTHPENLVPLFALQPFQRGDVNGDGARGVSDAVRTLLYLFAGYDEPSCLESADFDDDGAVLLNDAVAILAYVIQGGQRPPAPHAACGEDPTLDLLSCRESPSCSE